MNTFIYWIRSMRAITNSQYTLYNVGGHRLKAVIHINISFNFYNSRQSSQ